MTEKRKILVMTMKKLRAKVPLNEVRERNGDQASTFPSVPKEKCIPMVDSEPAEIMEKANIQRYSKRTQSEAMRRALIIKLLHCSFRDAKVQSPNKNSKCQGDDEPRKE